MREKSDFMKSSLSIPHMTRNDIPKEKSAIKEIFDKIDYNVNEITTIELC